MPRVLSLQSRVAYGYVGNAAATLPLQRNCCEVWPLDTVLFSNHTGHGRWTGSVVAAAAIAELFEGIAALGALADCDAVLSGYLGEAATGAVLLDIVARVKAANPQALFCCDPVIGDDDTGSYVRPGIAEFFRDRAVPQADIITPNRFELEYLTGQPVATLAEAAAAASALRGRGPRIVLVTSLAAAPDRIAMLAAADDGVWIAETPLVPTTLNGCGDATAALFLARLLHGDKVPDALALTAAAMHGIVAATHAAGRNELALVDAQDELVHPTLPVTPHRL